MHYLFLLAPAVLLVAYTANWYLCFHRNLQKAKGSGIPYVVVPVFLFHRFWLITYLMWVPYLRKLPEKCIQRLDFTLQEFSWELCHEIFKRVGSDTFLTVAPGGLAF